MRFYFSTITFLVIHMHCATIWKVTVQFPRQLKGLYIDLILVSAIVRLVSTQHPSGVNTTPKWCPHNTQVEMSTGYISCRVKVAKCKGLTTLPPECAV
jgi:hypothetical protein